MGDLMDMLDSEMGYMNTKDCDKELKKRDDAWKRKLDDVIRQNDQASKAKVEAMRKRVIQACNEHIKKIKQECNDRMRALGERCKAKIKTVMDLANDRHRSAMTVVRQENARLKAENARLAEAVARTAAAMTLSGMPRKRSRPGFRDLGNPSMW